MRSLRLFVMAAAVLAVAACNSTTTPPPETPDFPVTGKLLNAGDVPMPTTVSLVAIHPDQYTMMSSGLDPLSIVYGNFLAIATSPVAANGSFEWDLGDGSDIPAGYMAPASQALRVPPVFADITCSTTASAAVSVMRSFMQPGSLMAPLAVLGPVSDLTYADGLAIYTDLSSYDPALTEPYHAKNWLYSEGDVTITGGCDLDNGVDPVMQVVSIDLDLVEGWNEVYAVADPDAGTLDVNNEAFEGAWLYIDAF